LGDSEGQRPFFSRSKTGNKGRTGEEVKQKLAKIKEGLKTLAPL